MESGIWLVDRSRKCVRGRIEDPRGNMKTTDLKPLFPRVDGSKSNPVPFIISRNKNSINLVDIQAERVQPLIKIDNGDLFCEKMCIL